MEWCSSPQRRRTSARPATALLGLLPGQADGWVAHELAVGVNLLSPTVADKRQALDALLGLISSHTDGGEAIWLVGQVAWLASNRAG